MLVPTCICEGQRFPRAQSVPSCARRITLGLNELPVPREELDFMQRHRVGFAVVVCGLLLLPGAGAEALSADEEQGKRYALLVGIRQYYATELRDLDFAEADVSDLAQVFLDQGYMPENVVLMTLTKGTQNVRRLPMADRIRQELRLLLQGRQPEDSVVVALAGHGVKPRGSKTSYFCPIDAKLDDHASLLALDEVYKELEACGAGLKLLLVDACRNDPLIESKRGRPTVDLESVTRPELAPPPGGVVAFFSCSPGEVAFEHKDLRHGVFFNYVIEGLNGAAARPTDGRITLPLLEDYVKDRVERFVRDKYDTRQMPESLGREVGSVALARLRRNQVLRPPFPASPEAVSKTVERRRIAEAVVPSLSPRLVVRLDDSTTARQVVSLLQSKHLSKPQLDDAVALRWVDNFIRRLDPRKLYFEGPDVAEFKAQTTVLDDQVKEGNLDFAVRVFERLLKRYDERLSAVLTLVGETPDFGVDESIESDPAKVDYPADATEVRERWRKQIKLDLLRLKVDGVDRRDAVRRVTVRYRDQNPRFTSTISPTYSATTSARWRTRSTPTRIITTSGRSKTRCSNCDCPWRGSAPRSGSRTATLPFRRLFPGVPPTGTVGSESGTESSASSSRTVPKSTSSRRSSPT